MAPRAAADEAVTGEGEFTCDCGRTFTHGAWYTKHKLKCDGVAPATAGRIAARAGTTAIVPVGGRPRLPVRDEKIARRRAQYRRSAARRHNDHADRTPPAAIAAIAAEATEKATEIVIAGLIAKRALIDQAIAALQAVGSA